MLFAFALAFVVQLAYWWVLFGRLARWQMPKEKQPILAASYMCKHNKHKQIKKNISHESADLVPTIADTKCPKYSTVGVSVIICAKNEANNLLQNLPIVLAQNYQIFEVVVVNDASTDETAQILQAYKQQCPHLRIIDLDDTAPRTLQGKKHALQCGIEAAQYDFLILTDADCRPVGLQWLQCMANPPINTAENSDFAPPHIVLGYSPYETQATWLNACIQYETWQTAMLYFSAALCGLPYMGVGRNLAYSRALFRQNGGLNRYTQTPSGDDDLLINDIATPDNIYIMLHPQSFCISKAPPTWRHWIRQKQRHIGTANQYRPAHQLLLGTWALSQALFHVLFWALLFCPSTAYIALSLYTIKFALQFLFIRQIAQKIPTSLPIWKMILLDAFWFLYYLFFSLHLRPRKTIIWK